MWNTLTTQQKNEYKKHCDAKYGKTIVYCETGEPMYMDSKGNLINTELEIKLLFSVSEN